MLLVYEMFEIRRYRERVGYDREERQSRLLTKQTYAPDRRLGAFQQQRPLLRHRQAGGGIHEVRVVFSPHAEGAPEPVATAFASG